MVAVLGLALLVAGQVADGDEIALLAAQTNVEETSLRGAMNSQPGVATREYLRFIGALPVPEAPQQIASYRGVWDRLAACESTSNWRANTGNGYYGGLQEDRTFWANYGNHAYARPDLAPPAEQIAAAERGLAVQGWGAWPVCSRRLGLR